MLALCRAEWRKIGGYYRVTLPMLWLFPVIALAIVLLSSLLALSVRPEALSRLGLPGPGQAVYWPDYFMFIWLVAGTPVGRWLLVGFAAVLFAGEYGWGTWRQIAIRQTRARLILSKFIVLTVFICIAFGAASLILGFGMLIPVTIAGGGYAPALSGAVLAEFGQAYLTQAGMTVIAVLFGCSIAALAAILSRSILTSLMSGVAAFVLDDVLQLSLSLVGSLLNRPGLVVLTQAAPNYNLQNAVSWLQNGTGYTYPPLSQYAAPNSLGLSLLILALWLAGLIALTVIAFQRQDITD